MDQANAALIIFLKNYEVGKVKTRLAGTMGPENALTVYKQLVEITKQNTQHYSGQQYIYYSSFVDCEDQWNRSAMKRSQFGIDLGSKMSNAFHEVLEEHTHAIIIGTDCPYLQHNQLQAANDIVQQGKFAIGPSRDGGYYLLGLPKYVPEVFEGVDWSTDMVTKQTIERIKQKGFTYDLLDELVDVDYEEDWRAYIDFQQNVSRLFNI